MLSMLVSISAKVMEQKFSSCSVRRLMHEVRIRPDRSSRPEPQEEVAGLFLDLFCQLIVSFCLLQVFINYEKLLHSENYVTKRQSLKVGPALLLQANRK